MLQESWILWRGCYILRRIIEIKTCEVTILHLKLCIGYKGLPQNSHWLPASFSVLSHPLMFKRRNETVSYCILSSQAHEQLLFNPSHVAGVLQQSPLCTPYIKRSIAFIYVLTHVDNTRENIFKNYFKQNRSHSRVLLSVSAATNCKYFFMRVVWSTTVGLGVGTKDMVAAGIDRIALNWGRLMSALISVEVHAVFLRE